MTLTTLKRTGGIALIVLLAACATNSGVVPLGNGSYFLSRQAATGLGGSGNLKADAMREAADQCHSTGRPVQVVHWEESLPPYMLGNYPHVDLTFTCGASLAP